MATYKIKDKETGKVYTVKDRGDKARRKVQAGVERTRSMKTLKDIVEPLSPLNPYGASGMGGVEAMSRLAGHVKENINKPLTQPLVDRFSSDPFVRKGEAGSRLARNPSIAGIGQALGESQSPRNLAGAVQEVVTDPRTYLPGALKGAGGIKGPVRTRASAIANVKNPKAFAANIRSTLFRVKRVVGKQFEKGLNLLSSENPHQKVDISAPFKLIKNSLDDVANNPGLRGEVKSIIRKVKNPEVVKLINGLIEDPSKAKELTLRQAQDIKVAIQQAPSIARKLAKGKFADWTPGDIELLDLLDEIKVAQSSAFPQMDALRGQYSGYMSKYREVKNMFGKKQLLNNLRGKFGNEEVEEMVKGVLNKASVKDIEKFRTVVNRVATAKKVTKRVVQGILYLGLFKWGSSEVSKAIGGMTSEPTAAGPG